MIEHMEFTLKRRRKMKSLRVRVEPDGEVVVTAPFGVPRSYIMSFVMQHNRWIGRQKDKIQLRSEVFPVLDWERKIVSYLGKLYRLELNQIPTDDRVKVGTQIIKVYPVTGLAGHFQRTLLRWLKQEAERDIVARVMKWSQVMQTTYRSIAFRQQRSRWGSCGPDNELSFNWRLIHFKPEVIDYVVIHELAHTLHHNHSPRFWKTVEQYDASYRQKVAFLKNQQIVPERISQ
jgi:predicted metal-dependent hydrolase